jgi:hypothetical protein
MSKEMLNIARASSPANEYVRTNRSPPSSFLINNDLTAASAFALAEPAAGAFATPHNSGKYSRGTATFPFPLDAESLSGSARMLSQLNDDEEVVDKDEGIPLNKDLINHESQVFIYMCIYIYIYKYMYIYICIYTNICRLLIRTWLTMRVHRVGFQANWIVRYPPPMWKRLEPLQRYVLIFHLLEVLTRGLEVVMIGRGPHLHHPHQLPLKIMI